MSINLIVEDGTIVANANSYGSVADADAYFTARNNQTWLALDPLLIKPSCLIKGWDYMLQSYRTKWNGYRTSYKQTGDWPRYEVPIYGVSAGGYSTYPNYYLYNQIPNEIKNAQFELAYRASQVDDLAPDIDRITASEQIGTLKIVYDNDYAPIITYRAVDLLLKPFFSNSGLFTSIGRA